jgi:hypothetical protein
LRKASHCECVLRDVVVDEDVELTMYINRRPVFLSLQLYLNHKLALKISEALTAEAKRIVLSLCFCQRRVLSPASPSQLFHFAFSECIRTSDSWSIHRCLHATYGVLSSYPMYVS